ncbi:hypothetical protein T484DRAFT_1804234 [Baffinella frigidus]|nr:hypothetical protein T484DRAFT_1804234 [Cryptophyta sp. CCMP2293]
MRVYGGLAPPSPSTTPTQNWVDGHEEQRNADVATLNGVTLKRGPTGLEIVALSEFSAGAAMRSEGFLVGDTLTAVGGADVVGRSPGVFFAWIVEEDSGSETGKISAQGFRRVAAFPRPQRINLSLTVPQAPFGGQDRMPSADAYQQSSSSAYQQSGRHAAPADVDIESVLQQVENRASAMVSRGEAAVNEYAVLSSSMAMPPAPLTVLDRS